MNRRKLGRSDLQVSELGLGTRMWSWNTHEAAAREVLDGFVRVGGNFIQTRGVGADDTYGNATIGPAERYVGNWLKLRGVSRDDVVLSTRLSMRPADAWRETSDIVSDIQRSCEGSLRRLQVRFLDLLVLEWVDNAPLDEMLEAAEAVKRAGVVRHIAVSGFPAWRVMDWLGRSGRRKLRELAVVQNEFSLVSNAGMSAETLAVAREHRLGFVADSPLASGFFTARPASLHTHDNGRVRLLRETCSAVPALAEVNAISQALGTSPARVALAWVLAHPNVSSALIDARSIAELDDFAGATALNLSISDLLSLDRRWRMNPGGTTDDGPDTLGTETVDTGYGAVSVRPVSCGQAGSPRLVSAR